MQVPAATVNAEVAEAKAQSLSYVVLLAATLQCVFCIFVWKMVLRRKDARSNRFKRR